MPEEVMQQMTKIILVIVAIIAVAAVSYLLFFREQRTTGQIVTPAVNVTVIDEFTSICIIEKKSCTYSYLSSFLDRSLPFIFENSIVRNVLFEKYNEVQNAFRDRIVTENDFRNDAGLQFAVKLVPMYVSYVNAKKTLVESVPYANVTFVVEKVIFMKKDSWLGSSMQASFLRSLAKIGTIEKTSLRIFNDTITFSIRENVCDLQPTVAQINQTKFLQSYACGVFEFYNLRRYCAVRLQDVENAVVSDVLNTVYPDQQSILCQDRLSRLVNPKIVVV